MQNLKERKPLLIKILAVVLLVLLCCNLPSLLFSLLFWPLCLKQDRDIPPNTEVLISACNKRLLVTVTPDGKALFVRKVSASSSYRLDDVYLLDLHTGEKRDVPEDPLLMETKGKLLSSELVWLDGYTWGGPPGTENYHYRPDYILDLTDGQRYELINLNQMPLLDNKFDPKYYAYFQSAEQVFILQKDNMAIALSPDFRQNPEGNVIYFKSPTNGDFEDGEMLEKLMNDLGVKYKIVDFSPSYYYEMDIHYYYNTDILSPTGKYVVQDDGIYLSETKTAVLNRDMSDFQGWYYDESGVVVRKAGYCLIEDSNPDFGVGYHFCIPGTILKMRLPAP